MRGRTIGEFTSFPRGDGSNPSLATNLVFYDNERVFCMNKIENFTNYERGIIDSLINVFQYSNIEAEHVVKGYRTIVERIGAFNNPQDWARMLDEAMKLHITPDMWHNCL